VEEHNIQLSYTWVKKALQEAGLVAKQKRRGTHRRRRRRRPMPGMLLHVDESKHMWFQDGRYYDLITILDDATSEIYYAQLVPEEGTQTVMPAVREVVEKQGAANRFLREEDLAGFNRRFSVPAAAKGSAFVRLKRRDLDWVFSVQQERRVNNDNTIAIDNRVLQIPKTKWRKALAGSTVTVHEMLDGAIVIR
jgi:hypothetical protein